MELDFGAHHSLDLPLKRSLFEEYQNLLPEKLNKAIESRKEEFVAGRICALEAAKSLGHKLKQIPVGERREPIWPEGLVGSISHTKKMAISLVDKQENSLSVGIDIEEIIGDDKIETIERMVATKKELAFLNLFKDKNKAYTVLFSAKEALYKLIYPLTPVFFGFKEARLVALDLETGNFVLELISEQPELKPYNRKYSGQFFEKENAIISVIRIQA